ncbi:hypothetical protein [Caulobacter endophyticus]|uniref:hypothetical protein n=1 Tax=Caulobacter endophyticus TaxID=2172652 RepID=UPI0024102B54|nr:hypothetical protein [Caulobacter endophyticus]MDG2527534.1 hypothetical protein [Caulobacter endophyticus]
MIRRILAWLGGRGGRLEYWLAVVAILAFIMIMPGRRLPPYSLDFAALAAWCVFAARRLRDAGLPFWLAPFPLPIALVSIQARALLLARADGAMQTAAAKSTVNLYSAIALFGLVAILGLLPSRRPKLTADDHAQVFS